MVKNVHVLSYMGNFDIIIENSSFFRNNVSLQKKIGKLSKTSHVKCSFLNRTSIYIGGFSLKPPMYNGISLSPQKLGD